MAKRTSQFVQVGKRRLELSNLSKILFPEDGLVKAEVVQYYLQIAPTILHHIKGRALSLIRFPEGIHGESFFQKNRPDWAPEWIEYARLGSGEEKIEYMMATEEAVLVWLSNLACLEMHQIHSHKPDFDKPDYFVLDIDPPEGYPFTKVVEIAMQLKSHSESYGYVPFAKTTGGKGIHIVIPVEIKWDFHTVFEAASDMVKPFIEDHPETTLNIKKDARKGRVLIDIYRNRPSQTIVSPYSIRGRVGAPVSMPLTWDELKSATSPLDYNIYNAVEKVINEGDAWEGIASFSVPIHTQRPKKTLGNKPPPSKKYKTPEQLREYAKKRDFEKTTEPVGELIEATGNSFVVHRHHATRLHYDLRLEEDGVLKSWAVPKGMPQRPGIKRLAVQTEDHPLEYLTFNGAIPKGEYGAGNMWVYATGKYEYTKKKKDGFYFSLHGKQLEAEYRMHHTKDKEWLLERVDNAQIDWLNKSVAPMLAELVEDIPEGEHIHYEVKWDGIRALFTLDEGKMTIRSRNGNDISACFPELVVPEALRATNGLFDGEIVCTDADGKPNFHKVIQRLKSKGEDNINRLKSKIPAHCYLFDCLFLDGRSLVNEPLFKRREWLEDIIKKNTPFRFSEALKEGKELFEAAKSLNMEGIMAKDIYSKYIPGKRTSSWMKIKVRKSAESIIIGYTSGKGDRQELFGALHLGAYEGGELVYKGKVGTGFNQKLMKDIYEKISTRDKIKRPVKQRPVDEAQSVWISPFLTCEIQFSSITENNTYREPVFLRLRPDLDPENLLGNN